jgi:diacylglycerol O-acyltransferase
VEVRAMDHHPKHSEPMNAVDAAWYHMDTDTTLMQIVGILMFSRRLDFARLRATIAERFLSYDRFRQRVIEPHGGTALPHWEFDPHFDLDAHVRRMKLPTPGDQRALQDLAGELMAQPLDHARPLWRMYYVENYGKGSAVIAVLHHCIADGIALAQVMLSLTDAEPDAAWSGPPAARARHRTTNPLEAAYRSASRAMRVTRTLLDEGFEVLTDGHHAMTRAQQGLAFTRALAKLLLIPPDPATIFKGQCGGTKRAVWSLPIALDEVKAVGRITGSTVNDVLLAAVTGALRRYLERHQQDPNGINIRTTVPVNLRPLEQAGELGNRFGLVFFTLPIGIGDQLVRLQEFHRQMNAIKNSPEALVAFGILQAIGQTPLEIQNILVKIFGLKGTAVMTNVPGPKHTLYLAGQPVDNVIFWVPQAGGIGMGVSIMSYAGRVLVGVTTDADLVPDPEHIIQAFHDEFDALYDLVRVVEADGQLAQPGRCQGRTRAGKPCRNKPVAGQAFCRVHAV